MMLLGFQEQEQEQENSGLLAIIRCPIFLATRLADGHTDHGIPTTGSPPFLSALSMVASTEPVRWRSATIAAVGISGKTDRTVSIYDE